MMRNVSRRRRGEKCSKSGCNNPPNEVGLCDDCEAAEALELDVQLFDAMFMDLLRRIPPSNDPEQLAAERAAAKVLRLGFRVMK